MARDDKLTFQRHSSLASFTCLLICLFICWLYMSCKVHECVERELKLWYALHRYFSVLRSTLLNLCIRPRPSWPFEREISVPEFPTGWEMYGDDSRNYWWVMAHGSHEFSQREANPRSGLCLNGISVVGVCSHRYQQAHRFIHVDMWTFFDCIVLGGMSYFFSDFMNSFGNSHPFVCSRLFWWRGYSPLWKNGSHCFF